MILIISRCLNGRREHCGNRDRILNWIDTRSLRGPERSGSLDRHSTPCQIFPLLRSCILDDRYSSRDDKAQNVSDT